MTTTRRTAPGDRYARLVRSDIGRRVADALGLPQPAALRRYERGQPLLDGPALVSAAPGGELLDAAVAVLVAAGVDVHERPADDDTRYAAVVHDASGTHTADELDGLYRGVQAGVRRLARDGRVVVLGTDPGAIDDHARRTAQRALIGFVKSVAKEVDRGATANLVLVSPGAADGASAPLRFLLSARSAFVSGQPVVVGPATGTAPGPLDVDQPLAGRTAVVTGAARGIGAAIASVLARDGADVVCVDLPAAGEDLAGVANDVGGTAFGLDITAADAPDRLVQHLLDRTGGVDIVVHNAGVTRDKTLKGMDDDRWDLVLGVNLLAVERIDDRLLAADVLRGQGRIICMSSAVGGIAGNRGQTNYSTSKAGIIGHVEALASSCADRGATINAVAPGFIETEMTARMPFGPREVGRRIAALGQGGLPVDVAEAVSFLAAPDATWVNGRTLRVCGLNLLGA